MKSKRLLIILISVIFAVAVIFSVFAFFTIKKVDVKYAFSEKGEQSLEQLKKDLDGFVGGNLVFTNLDQIKEVVEKNPYFKVENIEKKFPNVVELSISERKDVYLLQNGDKKYFLSETGLVLSEVIDDNYDLRKVITLNLGQDTGVVGQWALSINSVTVGNTIDIDEIERLNASFTVAKSVNLTDCIKSMSVYKEEGSGAVDQKATVLSLDTYTGVKITIKQPEDLGEEKAKMAFELYDETSDYMKSFREIEAYKDDSGTLKAVWKVNG